MGMSKEVESGLKEGTSLHNWFNLKTLTHVLIIFSIFFTFVVLINWNRLFEQNSFTGKWLNNKKNFSPSNATNLQNKSQEQILNVLFIETKRDRKTFSMRQLCAVESAAFNNPNGNILVYSLNASIDNELLQMYKNIKFIRLDVDKVLDDTILEKWWSTDNRRLLKGSHPIEHLADLLRIVLLYKHGGIYSDLDTINIRSFKEILDYNGVGQADNTNPGNGFLVFGKHNKLLEKAMKEFGSTYNPHLWGANGPALFLRVIKQYCNSTDPFNQLLLFKTSHGLSKNLTCDTSIFPYNYFYPISWISANQLFQHDSSISIKDFIDTYSVHFYGKLTSNQPVNWQENSIYEYFSSFNCPLVYGKLRSRRIESI